MVPLDSQAQKGEIVGIQHLRGLASCGVVLAHCSGMMQMSKYYGATPFSGTLSAGNFGVDIFFVISGFIIVATSLDQKNLKPKRPLAEFLRRRWVRTIPIMWVAIIAYASLRFLGRSIDNPWLSYVRALLLWPSGHLEPGPIWTLRQEWLFYIVFGFTAISVQRRSALYIWLAAPALVWVLGIAPETASVPSTVLGVILHPSSLQFGFGVALGILYLSYPRNFASQPIAFGFPLLIFLTAAFFSVAYCLHLERTASDALLAGLISFFIVAVSLFVRPSDSILARLGEVLGAASYSIYLFHLGIISAQLGIASKLAPNFPVNLVLLPIVAITIAACIVIHYAIEKPLLRAFRGPHRTARQLAERPSP